MDDQTRRKLHRLLAAGRLSRPELEVIRERVLDEIERREGRFEPRTGRAQPLLEVKCRGGTLAACPKSSELVFAIAGRGVQGFLSAYAEPIGHDAQRVFYFSTQDGGDANVATDAAGPGVAERAVRIPAAQRAGRYRVDAYLARSPLGREQLQSGPLAADVLAQARVELVIVE